MLNKGETNNHKDIANGACRKVSSSSRSLIDTVRGTKVSKITTLRHKRFSPWRRSPSSTWRKCHMDFVLEKPALEVDEIRMDERAVGRLPSRPGGEGAGAEGTVEDADEEVSHPIAASEEK
jgi:hypothetical protein